MPQVLTQRSVEAETPHSGGNRCISCGGDQSREFLVAPDRFYSRSTQYRLVQCLSCSLVWLADPPQPSEMGQHYGAGYDRFIRKATEVDAEEHWAGALATVLRYKQTGALLDLGCGAGSFMKCLPTADWQLYGIEMSAESARRARRDTGASVFTGDILDAPLPAGMFDAITCFHVFEHLYSPREVMAKVFTWLKPGGVFCVHVPNIDAAEAKLFRSYWYGLELPRHFYHFSPSSLRRLGLGSGLTEVSLKTRRVSFLEYSIRYIADDLTKRVGIVRPSLASAGNPTLAWRLLRKGFRLTALPLVNSILALSGSGTIIEAVFRKPE
jgi:SAM-dependent methyltransferase